jgi:hypothetical protein
VPLRIKRIIKSWLRPADCIAARGPMYIATQQKDDKKIQALMKQFGKENMAMEDLLCDGCIGGRRVAAFCRKCEILDCVTNIES